MSVRCIDAVLNRSQHAGTELLMLVVLADYSDDEGNSYPSVAALARKCRTGQRNANYVLNALQKSGELRVLKNEGPRGTNRYRIMLAKLGANPLQPASPLHSIAALQSLAPLKQRSPVKPVSSTPAMQFPKPLHPSADEPSLNRQEPSKALKRVASPKAIKSQLPTDFSVSERVRTWAIEKGFDRLDDHFEHFIGAAKANGYLYVDWDQAFMNAIRGDWAKLRGNATARPPTRGPVLSSDEVFTGAAQ